MKRPGDPPPPSAQPAPKVRKSVTFLLPPRSPASSSSGGRPSSSHQRRAMTGGALPPALPSPSSAPRTSDQRRAMAGGVPSPASRQSSGNSAPRFTFDFVDDASFSASTIASARRSSYSSPTGRRGANTALSPSRLDARYSSRLPPSYGGHSPSHRSYTGGRTGGCAGYGREGISRNLFGGDANSDNNSSAMDESSDFIEVSSNGNGNGSNNNNHGNGAGPYTPGSWQRLSSPRGARWGVPPPSPTNRSLGTSAASSRSGVSSGVSTFLTSSPGRRGAVTGVSSPLSGNLGRASVSSSVASSPANSSPGGGMSVDYHERSGAGDRFIPSRALSNFNFELAAGTGSTNGVAREGGNSTAGGGAAEDPELLNPAPSFGATLMGAPVVDATPAAGGAGAAAGPDGPPISPTFSEDAASADGSAADRHDATNRQPLLYDALLRSELLGENVDPAMHSAQSPTGLVSSPGGGGGSNVVTPFRERSNNLRFSPNNRQFYQSTMYGGERGDGHRRNPHSSIVSSFGLAPVSMGPNQRASLGSYTERCKRKIAKVPTKVLDAPALQDDFYLNLVDWSSQNVLAVGLGSSVYLWSAATSRVTQLCDLSPTEDAVTSVAWSEGGRHLAIGSTRGDVQLWDAPAQRLVRTMTGHSARVGALSWKPSGAGGGGSPGTPGHSSLLASGSRDRLIHLRDPRSDGAYEMRLLGHKQEVCGLRWSFDERSMLASGGNDNKLLVWDVKRHTRPCHAFADHTAAVKAIAWSPHQHGLLASGGGTADRCIRFWNCLTGHGINCIDTGSQVCNLAFSKNCNELVSTHGYSLNQIVVWKYPSMQKIATLTGHTYRVLYLALSPDGSTIVTGAGDETLRFWQIFPGPQKENKAGGLLFPAGMPGSVIR